jgi:hypothetical protein
MTKLTELESSLTETFNRMDVYLKQFVRKLQQDEEKYQNNLKIFKNKEYLFLAQRKAFSDLLSSAAEFQKFLVIKRRVTKKSLSAFKSPPIFVVSPADPYYAFRPLSRIEQREIVQFHYNVIFAFIHEHLNNRQFLQHLERQLRPFFSRILTDANFKWAAYQNLENFFKLTPSSLLDMLGITKNRLTARRRLELLGYLKALCKVNVFVFDSKNNQKVCINDIKATLECAFKTYCHAKDTRSIQSFYKQEPPQLSVKKDILPKPKLRKMISASNKNNQSKLKIVKILNTLEGCGGKRLESADVLDQVQASANQLIAALPEAISSTALRDYALKVKSAATEIEKLPNEINKLREELDEHLEYKQALENCHQLLKYQIAAACGAYRLAMSHKNFVEKLWCTAEGLNAAKKLLMDIEDTEFIETIEVLANFLRDKTTLRDRSLSTILLRVLHVPEYGFISLGNNPYHPAIAEQLKCYRNQISLRALWGGVDYDVRVVEPDIPHQDIISKALNKDLGWWGIFNQATQERRFIRDTTVHKLFTTVNSTYKTSPIPSPRIPDGLSARLFSYYHSKKS